MTPPQRRSIAHAGARGRSHNGASAAQASCDACGKSHAKLLLCGRCRNAWFCNRECQLVARKELGHRGANCRPADVVQRPPCSADARSSVAAPSQLSRLMEMAQLAQRFNDLSAEGHQAQIANTRNGYFVAAEKHKEAASVADLIGGAEGAARRSDADQLQANCLLRSGNMAAAARAAVSSARAARAAGNRTAHVIALSTSAYVAKEAPDAMAKAERESREQDRPSGSPSCGGLDLSQEGRISLPTTRAARSRLGVAYFEAAVAVCEAALAYVGGRGSPAADDERRVPSLRSEAEMRNGLGTSLHSLGERRRGVELVRQAVLPLRRDVFTAAPGSEAPQAKRMLVIWLSNLGAMLMSQGADRIAEAAACFREALELSEETDDVALKQAVLSELANMSGRPDQPVGLAEAAAFRSRLNALYAQAGRNHDTSCTICLEPLEMPYGGAEDGAADDSGRDADGYTNSAVRVLDCAHQFHRGCLSTWWRTRSDKTCPLCKK